VSQAKVSVIGAFRLSEEGDPECSIDVGKGPGRRTQWLGVKLSNVEKDCPGLGAAPEEPEGTDRKSRSEWYRACSEYARALREHPNYKDVVSRFVESQQSEPQPGLAERMWIYRDRLCRVEPLGPRDDATERLLVKHHVLRQEQHYEKIRREVEAFENMEKLEGVSREPIPQGVRLFVWQRDKGQCVKCNRREKLEFDHIIPIASGGSSTERNVQLLCESCNRSKGATI